MEQKTAEEILEYHYDTSYASIKIAMQAYAKQQQEIAVDKALEIASEKAVIFLPHSHYHVTTNIDKQSILSLKPEILKELNK